MLRSGKYLFAILAICTSLIFLPVSGAQNKNEAIQNHTLLGQGRGLDHVMVAVRDLSAAENAFRSLLGFKVNRWGKFPDGVENGGVSFRNGSYLEFLGIYDYEKAAQTSEAKSLRSHEGAIGLAMHVSSAMQTATFLKSRGFDVKAPESMDFTPEGETQQKKPLWQIVSFKKPVVPGGIVFFIQYNEKAREESRKEDRNAKYETVHPNTAEKISSVWVAVKDLDAAVKGYNSIGLTAGRQVKVPHLGATGREINAGEGVILLLQPNDSNGEAASFLKRRGEEIMGVSIKVTNLDTARNIVETNLKRKLSTYRGPYGRSFLVPDEITRGLWFEMFQ